VRLTSGGVVKCEGGYGSGSNSKETRKVSWRREGTIRSPLKGVETCFQSEGLNEPQEKE